MIVRDGRLLLWSALTGLVAGVACDLAPAPGITKQTDGGDASAGDGATPGTSGAGGTAGGAAGMTSGGTGGISTSGGAGGRSGGAGGVHDASAGSAGRDATGGGRGGSAGSGTPDAGDGRTPDASVPDDTAVGTVGHACSPEAAKACAGHAQAEQLTCTNGVWQSAGTCAVNTHCTTTPADYAGECRPALAECVGQAPGTLICRGKRPDICGIDLVDTDDPNASYIQCKLGCTNANCTASCSSLATNCGRLGTESCCANSVVTGGTFYRQYDDVSYQLLAYPAKISDFALDEFEVTVGRFRAFVSAWLGGYRPQNGAGKHTQLNGGSGLALSTGGYEPGWNTAWAANLATTAAGWNTNLACDSARQTWTSSAGANENRPINCVTWYEMYAFAIWDLGVLPSAAEWNYAASGGNEQRLYPWSKPANSNLVDCLHANYRGSGASADYCVSPSTMGATTPVGSFSPADTGKFGQADLAGNLSEWLFDEYVGVPPKPCTDCAGANGGGDRTTAGGSFATQANALLAASPPDSFAPSVRSPFIGGRVARPAPIF